MDIRNFFPVKISSSASKTRPMNGNDSKAKKNVLPSNSGKKINTRKRTVVLSDSDSEDPIPKPKPAKRRIIEDDDDDNDCFEITKTKKAEPVKEGVRRSPRKQEDKYKDSADPEDPIPKPKRRKQRIIEDDDEDVDCFEVTPTKKTEAVKEGVRKSPRKHEVKHKNSKPPPPPIPKEKKKEEKVIEVSKFFGKTPVDRSSKHLVEKKAKIEKITPSEPIKKKTKLELSDDEFLIEDDEEFEKTLAQLDIPGLSATSSNLIESVHSSQDESKITKPKENELKLDSKKIEKGSDAKGSKSESKSKVRDEITDIKQNGHDTKSKSKTGVMKEEKKLDTSILDNSNLKTPEEKKKEHFQNYQHYLHREGPTALGSKEIPEGADSCLEGKTFVLTGILESIERDEAKTLIEKYKGKVTSTLSKNTQYIVVGRDSGPAKLEKAEKFGTIKLNEDELFDLIRTAPPGKSAKKTKPNESPMSKTKNKASKMTPKNFSESLEDSLKENNMIEEIVKPSSSKGTKQDEPKSTSTFSPPKRHPVTDSLMWVDKHKPQSLKQVIGQQGDRSNAKKLVQWLRDWQKNRTVSKKPPSRWGGGGGDDGGFYKAALLSGTPGIGKTTTAVLACKELGFSYFELNASDTRSKRSLHDEVSQLLQNTTITGLGGNKSLNSTKHVIIMDEVDGMSGNQDRGGTQELIALIKTTKIPIICICNDRSHPKIRSLSNYCFDLRFQKPRLEQIKGSIMSICYKEGIKIPTDVLTDIITASCQDVRQVLHNVFLWSAKVATIADGEKKKMAQTKDIKIGPFDVLKKVFASEEEKSSIHDKASLFFHDYSLSPLFVQENYIHVQPKNARGNQLEHLKLISQAADSIRDGDMVDRVIRTSNNWSLLPTQAIFSSVIPGDTMRGYLSQMITFPSWLGKNSTKNHMDRVLQQLQMHMRLRISGNKTELNTQYIPLLHHKLTNPLVEKESDGVKEVINTMENYYLLREDLEIVTELALWPGKTDPMSKVNPKVKGALTRTFNKESFLIPYSMNTFKKGKKASVNELEGELGEEDDNVMEENAESDDDIGSDAMVKQKKATKTSTKSDDQPSTSKGKGKGKTSNPQSKRGRKK